MARFLPAQVVPARWRAGLFAVGRVSFYLCLAQAIGVARTAASSAHAGPAPGYAEDRILIQPKAGIALEALAGFHAAHKGKVLRTFEGIGRLQVLSVPKAETVPGFIAK